jgi:hypothetical protein
VARGCSKNPAAYSAAYSAIDVAAAHLLIDTLWLPRYSVRLGRPSFETKGYPSDFQYHHHLTTKHQPPPTTCHSPPTPQPFVNPDGYEYTWSNTRLWRKNREPNAGSTCIGTDVNRNYNEHWGEGGGSTNPCSDTFQGPTAFSSPEVGVKPSLSSSVSAMPCWPTCDLKHPPHLPPGQCGPLRHKYTGCGKRYVTSTPAVTSDTSQVHWLWPITSHVHWLEQASCIKAGPGVRCSAPPSAMHDGC